MLDLKFLRENLEEVEKRLKTRGGDSDLSGFKELDIKRRKLLTESETLKARRNAVSEEIGKLKREKKDASNLVAEMQEEGAKLKALEADAAAVEEEMNAFLLGVPNVPHSSVPVGKDSNDNPVVRKWGEPKTFGFSPKEHTELGEKLGILDFERAGKISGARFSPLMGTGQLPKFKEDLFKIEGWDHYLIPTAEVPVTNILNDEIIEEERLPICYTAFTPCFRSEAGSYGKDVKGLIRQHQFNKVEMVKFSSPETSYDELEKLTDNAEDILRRLGLPYQVVLLCTGDIGFSSPKTYH